ncbi:hypothetical protein P7D98_06900 [Enterococcus avium]|jgi:hypothetical protein|nr:MULTISPECIES: hypothetical protein [Bacillota]HAQ4333088.1 hypothetical protein [Enterococcus faecium]HBE9761096.1 hypothetical protein [Clostridioides difficile]MDT2465387.1 hypothetical protein [Enterococcus avium]MDT2504814.1 hypothetical protein [Enterococcus avium]HAQ4336055.1 hypothetical protein [Enterococcus faecium]
MKSNDMINLIIDVEKNQHGITQLYPSRIHYFQRTKRYDKYTYEVTYDEAFEQMILDFEKAIGGTIYRPTAKKILNNWFSWAVEQRSALINLISRKKMNYSYLLFNEK